MCNAPNIVRFKQNSRRKLQTSYLGFIFVITSFLSDETFSKRVKLHFAFQNKFGPFWFIDHMIIFSKYSWAYIWSIHKRLNGPGLKYQNPSYTIKISINN
jgi:hypothetical protein